jgi:hypothetical protein
MVAVWITGAIAVPPSPVGNLPMFMPCFRSLVVLLAASWSASARAADTPPAGYTTLFDGATLNGWRGGTTHDPQTITPEEQAEWDAAVPPHWRVENGEIVSDGNEPHLVTEKEYGDFELWVDWKLSPNGDSGIYLRGCPQVQLWDPANENERANGADKGSGGLWNNEKYARFPTEVADKPPGEWNRMQISIVGRYVAVTLNDKRIVNWVPLENYFDREALIPARGAIHLQTHGSETRFRNLFLREIPPAEADALLGKIAGQSTEFTPLFNGRDLTGWIGATESYEVANGAIRCKPGQGGNLLYDRQYKNFIARLEFRLSPGGNNGLAIRTPGPDVDSAYEGIELQVIDNDAPQYAELKPYQYHGSAYGLAAARRGYLHPTGKWNYQQVTVDGDKIQVELNGYPILDLDLATVRDNPPDGNAHPGAARTSGYFGFAGHNDPVEFRNIRIKELD